MTITVNGADVGSPGPSSLLESVGSYAFAATLPSGAITNAGAQADNVPIELDGACCFNFGASASANLGCSRAQGNGRYADGDFDFDADHNCDGDGRPDHVTFKRADGRTFTAATIASVTYNVDTLTMVVSGEGLDSGQTVTYTATFVQGTAGSGPLGAATLVLSDGLTMGGNLVGGVLDFATG